MNNATLGGIAVAAVAVAVGTVLLVGGGGADAPPGAPAPLFPGIEARLAETDRVVIDTGTETITLERRTDQLWAIAEQGGVMAQWSRLRPIMNGFATMETLEAMTASRANHGRLGLADPGEGDGAARRVTLMSGGTEIASLLVGNTRGGWQSTRTVYVRRPGEDQTWLVRSPIDVSGSPDSFREGVILDLPLDRIFLFESDLWDERGLVLRRPARDGQSNFMMLNLPEQSDVTSQGHLQGPPRALASLAMEDATTDEAFFNALSSPARIRVETIDGLDLRLVVAREEEGDRYWMSIEPRLSGDVVPEELVMGEFERMAMRHAGLYYRIPQWRAVSLLRPAEEVITRRETPLDPVILEVPRPLPGTEQDPELLRLLQGVDLSGEGFELPRTGETMRFFTPEDPDQ